MLGAWQGVLATDLLAQETERRCLHAEQARVSVAVGDDIVSDSGNGAASENDQAHLMVPLPPPQLGRQAKRMVGRQEPGRKHTRTKVALRDGGRQPLLPLLFSGVDGEGPKRIQHTVSEQAGHQASDRHAPASEEDGDLAEEMDALRRAQFSRQITEDRLGKNPLSGRRKPCAYSASFLGCAQPCRLRSSGLLCCAC